MKKSYLVQRLTAPAGRNPFSFGGGLENGGLSDEAMSLLDGVWSFDYMGAAEFEFGAVQEAIYAMANTELVSFEFEIAMSDVAKDFREKGKPPRGSKTIYVVTPAGTEQEVEKRIRHFALEPYKDLKCPILLSATLRPATKWDGRIIGWLELNNGWFFTVDKTMFESAKTLFGM